MAFFIEKMYGTIAIFHQPKQHINYLCKTFLWLSKSVL